MDGSKPVLRHLLLAALALSCSRGALHADDFLRPPARPITPTDERALGPIRPPAKSPVLTDSHPRTRHDLAAIISAELVGHTSRSQNRVAAGSLEPAPGWQAVGEELKGHLDKCETLLSHNAFLSARQEADRATIHLVRVLDLRQNKCISEPAWAQAQQALREAQDFTKIERVANDTQMLTRLIQSHETPALRGLNVADLTPLAAAQHYRAYAEERMVEASQGHPWFSELYYSIGRTLQAQSESGDPQASDLLQQSLTYYRSAHAVQPTNATNSNQLGYVLLRMDRPREALAQLNHTVAQPGCPLEAWQNLVQASSRLGDAQAAAEATATYLALRAQGVTSSEPTGTLIEVDPRQFAAMSPHTSGPRADMVSTSTSLSSTSQSPSSEKSTQSSNTNSATGTPPRSATGPFRGLFR